MSVFNTTPPGLRIQRTCVVQSVFAGAFVDQPPLAMASTRPPRVVSVGIVTTVAQVVAVPAKPAGSEADCDVLMAAPMASFAVVTALAAMVGVVTAPVPRAVVVMAPDRMVGFGSVPVRSPPSAPFHAAYIVS